MNPAIRCRPHSRAAVLIVTLWVLLALAGLAVVFGHETRTELAQSANDLSAAQADAIAHGAIQAVLVWIDNSDTPPDPTGIPAEAVSIGTGYYWLLQPAEPDAQAVTFGLVDEAGLVSLNGASADMLAQLPNATPELAAAIVDWRDPDDQVTLGGAESTYYLLLPDPYYCKSGPFETVEELLLVKDATRELLYGNDVNRNGLDDDLEAGRQDEPTINAQRGIWDILTVYSREPNTDELGQRRINVNSGGMGSLIGALRSVLQADRLPPVIAAIQTGRPFANIMDFYYKTGLTSDEFGQIADRLTTSGSATSVGLMNVNTAPRQALMCLPGLDEGDAAALVSKRDSGADLSSIAWVAETLPREKAVAIGGLITTRSYQLTADIVAVSGDGRAFRRYRAVIDARTIPSRVLTWTDLTPLGWPLSEDILTSLRKGLLPDGSAPTGGR